MTRTAAGYVVLLGAAFASYLGVVVVPRMQLAGIEPVRDALGDLYPPAPEARVAAGRRVYISLGCVHCHTQQIRATAADLDRGWGQRRSIPADYLHDDPPLLGSQRTGPDLSTIGTRQPSRDWHYRHLYDPVRVVPGSNMPPHPFLFRAHAAAEPGALSFAATKTEAAVTFIPTEDALALVAYLTSLRRDALLTGDTP